MSRPGILGLDSLAALALLGLASLLIGGVVHLHGRVKRQIGYVLSSGLRLPAGAVVLRDVNTYDGNFFGEREEEFAFSADGEYVRALIGKPLWEQPWRPVPFPGALRSCRFGEEGWGAADIYARSGAVYAHRAWKSDAG
jgi:hypothetical protein